MSLEKIEKVIGKGVFVPGDDIDTDRIIPARFMKCVTFDGLGQYAFYDVRFDENGDSKNHPMDKPEHKSASILISGKNFGCGSSREHAPQALYHWGIRAVVAESYAEIFFGNCTTLGIPCVVMQSGKIEKLGKLVNEKPEDKLTIDLQNSVIKVGAESFDFEIPNSTKTSLMGGKWDSLAELLESKNSIKKTSDALDSVY